jgi:hypothetical protein
LENHEIWAVLIFFGTSKVGQTRWSATQGGAAAPPYQMFPQHIFRVVRVFRG